MTGRGGEWVGGSFDLPSPPNVIIAKAVTVSRRAGVGKGEWWGEWVWGPGGQVTSIHSSVPEADTLSPSPRRSFLFLNSSPGLQSVPRRAVIGLVSG